MSTGRTLFIKPTHTCFDDALDTLSAFVLERPDIRDDLRLVHGICLAPDGNPYSHAWLEDTTTDQVIFTVLLKAKPTLVSRDQAEFYAEAQVQETTVYTWRQALKQNRRSGHFGPWRKRYRDLCRVEPIGYTT